MHQQGPKKWKIITINWLFVYPLINVLFYFLFPLIQHYNQLIKTLVLTLILVPIMAIFIPKIHRRCWRWLIK
jgi:antibiotic biosynthesis monooxygenase (ABM) superfamily enzyme